MPRSIRRTLIAAATMLGIAFTLPAGAQTPPNGLIAFNSYKSADGDIYVVNPDGTGEINVTGDQPPGEGHDDQGADWSPDGSLIAFTRYRFTEGSDVHVISPDGSGLRAVTEEQGTFEDPVLNSQPDWSPDGTRLAFTSDREGNLEIWQIDADGTDPVQLTSTDGPARNIQPAWSSDGTKIAFVSTQAGTGQDLWVMDADGSDPINLTNVPDFNTNYWHPTWSPDGTKLAFTKSSRAWNGETWVDQNDIWMSNPDGSGAVNLTDSPESEYTPSFSPDGSKLSFVRQYMVDGEWRTDVFVMDLTAQSAKTTTFKMAAATPTATQVTSNGTAADPDWGTAGSPTGVTCQGLPADNVSTEGVIEGTAGGDVLVGGAGANTIRSFGGDDVICAGRGRDTVSGGSGADDIYGQGGSDTLNGGGGRDELFGGAGTDTCSGGTGSDQATSCETKTSIP
jgi:Tol biopolymer transport system component